MDFVQNFPFMSILISLFSGPLCSILDGKWAKRVNSAVITIIGALSADGTGLRLSYGAFSGALGK